MAWEPRRQVDPGSAAGRPRRAGLRRCLAAAGRLYSSDTAFVCALIVAVELGILLVACGIVLLVSDGAWLSAGRGDFGYAAGP
jgi:hypothetical protein